MIEGGDHLWNGLRYIDLNMVRAGVVRHPSDWEWCGYRELVGERMGFCLLDTEQLLKVLGIGDHQSLIDIHQQRISEAIKTKRLARESIWTESVAVGSETFVRQAVSKNRWRKRPRMAVTPDGICYVAEEQSGYSRNHEGQKRHGNGP